MLNGILLTLLIGPTVPVPAPKVVIDALTSVQVNSGGDKSGFQLTFGVGKMSPLLTTMVPSGYFDPVITRVIIVVTFNGIPNVLLDGIITRQELAPGNEPGQSTLTITGEDLSVLMDIVEMPSTRYPAMSESDRVQVALSNYLALGIQPNVVDAIFRDAPSSTKEIPSQTGTDLSYIRLLANRVGYTFYLEPGPMPGASTAYWGPDIRSMIPQPALTIDMDAETNVESLTFSLDGLAKKILVLNVLDPVTDTTVPITVPNISLLRPSLGARLTPPARVEYPVGLSKLSPLQAGAVALGISFAASDAITCSGSLDVLRYGHILKARQVVGVRGASVAYDGMYYVNTVTHNLKRGEYKQNFTLSRDGLISLTSVVMP